MTVTGITFPSRKPRFSLLHVYIYLLIYYNIKSAVLSPFNVYTTSITFSIIIASSVISSFCFLQYTFLHHILFVFNILHLTVFGSIPSICPMTFFSSLSTSPFLLFFLHIPFLLFYTFSPNSFHFCCFISIIISLSFFH